MPALQTVVPMKVTATVPWSEVEPLFNRLRTGTGATAGELLRSIGYDSTSSIVKWQKDSKCPLRVKYALLGMAAEISLPAATKQQIIWTHSELADLFGLTIGLQLPDGSLKHLQGKLATALQGDSK